MSNLLPEYCIKKTCTTQEIQDWLVSEIATLLGVKPHEIDINRPLDSYGLDSGQAVIITNKTEKFLGVKLSLIHLWYYPTIKEMSERLSEEFANSQSEVLQL